jgi:DNA-binding FrmR family transcriptional regulator
MARSSKSRHNGVPVDHTQQLPRLKRIEGQVRGIQQMIEQERNCVDIAHQISACIAALRRVQGDMLRDHLTACAEGVINGKLSDTERRRLADEVGDLLIKFG